ncbi:MAG: hypothetical protein ACK481_01600 [Candidatus Melainabacteria bacterium]|jgi:hypothetical protein
MSDQAKVNEIAVKEIESLGIQKLRSGEFLEAIELLKQAIHEGSKNFQSRFLLTRLLIEQEKCNQINQTLLGGNTKGYSDFLPNSTWEWFSSSANQSQTPTHSAQ